MTVNQLLSALASLDPKHGNLPVLIAVPGVFGPGPLAEWHVPTAVKPDEDRLILNCEPL